MLGSWQKRITAHERRSLALAVQTGKVLRKQTEWLLDSSQTPRIMACCIAHGGIRGGVAAAAGGPFNINKMEHSDQKTAVGTASQTNKSAGCIAGKIAAHHGVV